jgi:hypothetical protein
MLRRQRHRVGAVAAGRGELWILGEPGGYGRGIAGDHRRLELLGSVHVLLSRHALLSLVRGERLDRRRDHAPRQVAWLQQRDHIQLRQRG